MLSDLSMTENWPQDNTEQGIKISLHGSTQQGIQQEHLQLLNPSQRLWTGKRPRSEESETGSGLDHSQKRPRPSRQGHDSRLSHALTRANLEILEKLSAASTGDWVSDLQEDMERGRARGRLQGRRVQAGGRTASRGQSRQPLSQPSSTADDARDTSTQRTQKTSCTAANYRFTNLEHARIYVEVRRPPPEIQKQIDAILLKETTQERKGTLAKLANEFCDAFWNVLPTAAGEDDCVNILFDTLRSLCPVGKVKYPRKAGTIHSPLFRGTPREYLYT